MTVLSKATCPIPNYPTAASIPAYVPPPESSKPAATTPRSLEDDFNQMIKLHHSLLRSNAFYLDLFMKHKDTVAAKIDHMNGKIASQQGQIAALSKQLNELKELNKTDSPQ